MAGIAAVALAACPRRSGTGPEPVPTVDAGPGVAVDAGVTGVAVDAGEVVMRDKPAGGLVPVGGVACTASPCVYYPGTNTHYQCLSGAAGRCFHYGPPCVPVDRCMYDAGQDKYRECQRPGDGRCDSFGGPCQPSKKCLYSSADQLYRGCKDFAQGKCLRFGPACDP